MPSATCTVKLKSPAARGIPVTLPKGLMISPKGRDPEASDQILGCEPPIAVSPAEYATPTIASGRDLVVILMLGCANAMDAAPIHTVRTRVFISSPPE